MVRTPEALDRLLIAMEAFDIMADERFTTIESRQEHGEAFTEMLAAIFKTRTSSEWLTLLREEHEVPVELVATFSDLHHDPHVSLNNIAAPPAEDIGMQQVINDPVNVEGHTKLSALRAPEMGEHTDSVLQALGYTDREISALREGGVV